jgi:hypothetical protein
VKRVEVRCIYTYEDSTMKPTKHYLKEGKEEEGEWEYNRRGELIQGILYAYVELS